MKTNVRDLEFEGDLTFGETHRFGFDPESVEALMELLTDAYSDPMMACLRELAVNARDSHVEAGNPDPIEVLLPTEMEPELVIRDRGIGLHPQMAVDVFTLYGKSTKRDSDEFTGMLGIGSKSPLAYCEAFTVIARKDGVQTTLLVGRGKDEVGELSDLIEPTDEPDGVTIKIPVEPKDFSAFEKKARWLFKFWQSPVLVNGERLDNGQISGFTRLNDEIALGDPDYSYEDSYVVMGDVPYRVPSEHRKLRLNHDPTYVLGEHYRTRRGRGRQLINHVYEMPFIVWVPIGTVQFTPDRENLKMKERTLDTLSMLNEWVEDFGARMLHDYAASIPFTELVGRYSDNKLLGMIRPYWNGRTVPALWQILEDYANPTRVHLRDNKEKKVDDFFGNRENLASLWGISSSSLLDATIPKILIRGYKPHDYRDNYLYRILRYAEMQGMKFKGLKEVVILANGPEKQYYFDFDYVMHWEDVKAATKAVTQLRKKRQLLPIEVFETNNVWIRGPENGYRKYTTPENIDKFKPVVYSFPSDYEFGSEAMGAIWHFIPEAQFMTVYKKQHPMFMKMQPGAVHYKEVCKWILEDQAQEFTYMNLLIFKGAAEFVGYRFARSFERSNKSLDAIKDVHLRELVVKALDDENGARDAGASIGHLRRIARACGTNLTDYMKSSGSTTAQQAKADAINERISRDYPLRYSAMQNGFDGFIEYVNAMYDYRLNNPSKTDKGS